ncbi:pyruvate formate-lyase [Klebsiella michiganensis]|nr:pyruvate formate-lyase [Klebsiella michiganensis]
MVIPAFLNRGVSLDDARDYSVVGCVELSIPGRTYGLHDIAMFNLLKVMEIVMLENESNPDITWDGLINQIRDKIRYYIKLMVEGSNICDIGHRDWAPVPLLSSFIEDCVQHGQDITEGGARYNFSGVQGIGIANLSDSLHALKGMVFEQKRLSFAELIAVLKANFQTPEGEKIRARLINRFEKYGNDIDEVDNISADLLRFYCKEVEQYQTRAAVALRRAPIPSPPTCRWGRSSARRRTDAWPGSSWRTAGCRRCLARTFRGRPRCSVGQQAG